MGTNKLRLLFCSNGTNTYDPFFLDRLSKDFEAYLATFLQPNQIFEVNAKVIQLRDFGGWLRNRKINNLRIAVSTLWRALQIRRCVDDLKPDVIIGNWVTTFGLYIMLSRRTPFILFAYGEDIVVDPYRSPFHRAVTTEVIKSARIVLIDSEVQRRALLSLGCSRDKILCFPWFDENDLRKVDSDPSLRHKLGWERNTVVVCVRNHEPEYAVDTLIRAIPRVLRKAPNVRFLIFGSGTQTSRLIQLAHNLEVWPYLHFAGQVPRHRLLRQMKDCDIYVSASITDGTSSSLLEAMSLGVPVVVTSIHANREWITHAVNGLMFPIGDAEKLARAIVDLDRDPARRERLQRAARLVIRRRVDWKSSYKELMNTIRMSAEAR